MTAGLGRWWLDEAATAISKQRLVILKTAHGRTRKHRLYELLRRKIPVRGNVVNHSHWRNVDATMVRHKDVVFEGRWLKLTKAAMMKTNTDDRLPRIDAKLAELLEELIRNIASSELALSLEPTDRQECGTL